MAGNQSASSALGLALEGEPEHANLEELPKVRKTRPPVFKYTLIRYA